MRDSTPEERRKNPVTTRSSGQQTESDVIHFLDKRGLTLLERNFSCKLGEIDVIATDGSLLLFIEVRKRQHPAFGKGFETVDRHKQKKIIRTAKIFLQQRKIYRHLPCRFDIVSVEGAGQFTWIRDAFQEC